MGRIVGLGFFQRQSAEILTDSNYGTRQSTGTIDTRRKTRQAMLAMESTFFDRCGGATYVVS